MVQTPPLQESRHNQWFKHVQTTGWPHPIFAMVPLQTEPSKKRPPKADPVTGWRFLGGGVARAVPRGWGCRGRLWPTKGRRGRVQSKFVGSTQPPRVGGGGGLGRLVPRAEVPPGAAGAAAVAAALGLRRLRGLRGEPVAVQQRGVGGVGVGGVVGVGGWLGLGGGWGLSGGVWGGEGGGDGFLELKRKEHRFSLPAKFQLVFEVEGAKLGPFSRVTTLAAQ